MSNLAMPRAPGKLLSSNKIEFSEVVSDEPRLGKLWGGIFFHPGFIYPAREILDLQGQPSYITIDSIRSGAVNLLWRQRAIFHAASLPLLFQYYGPLIFESAPRSAILTALDEYLPDFCDFAFLSFSPDVSNLDGLSSKWKIVPNVTLALKGEELKNWGGNFRDDVKNKINKAAREKVEIYETDELPVKLWETAYARKNISTPIKPALLERWCRALVEASLLRIFTARLHDEIIAFRGELLLGDYAYDWIAGSNPEFHSIGANQLLMAQIGRELSLLNLTAWDLVGGEVASIAEFKRSFGARDFPYLQAWRSFGISGKLFQLSRRIRHGRD
jgi:hypothetical protein